MPSKKKRFNARFPPARIKKIMQTDEDIGKVAAPVPVIISRALELFLESILTKTCAFTRARNAKTLSCSHIKHTVLTERNFDFLKDLVADVPDMGWDDEDVAAAEQQQQQLPQQHRVGGKPRGRPRKSSQTARDLQGKRGNTAAGNSSDGSSRDTVTDEEEEEEEEEDAATDVTDVDDLIPNRDVSSPWNDGNGVSVAPSSAGVPMEISVDGAHGAPQDAPSVRTPIRSAQTAPSIGVASTRAVPPISKDSDDDYDS